MLRRMVEDAAEAVVIGLFLTMVWLWAGAVAASGL
jgi:hypothetical protein